MACRVRPNTARGKRVSIPSVVTEDAIGLGDDVPTFDIGEGSVVDPQRADMFGISSFAQGF